MLCIQSPDVVSGATGYPKAPPGANSILVNGAQKQNKCKISLLSSIVYRHKCKLSIAIIWLFHLESIDECLAKQCICGARDSTKGREGTLALHAATQSLILDTSYGPLNPNMSDP